MHRNWMLLGILAISTLCLAQDPPSVADQAAAAQREKASIRLSSEQAGHVVNGNYRNELLGLQVQKLPDWQAMSRGEMNVKEAEGREQMGVKGAVHSGQRVYGMNDLRGASLFISVAPLPAGADTRNLKAQLVTPLKSQLPDPQFSDEPVTLADPAHPFVGFRVAYKVNDKLIFQSQQAMVKDGHLVAFVLTANSPDDLTAIWQDLKSKISWSK